MTEKAGKDSTGRSGDPDFKFLKSTKMQSRQPKNVFDSKIHFLLVCFVFVALRPMSTAMVIAGRSVHLTTLFPGQA